jgi:hypothetical protein
MSNKCKYLVHTVVIVVVDIGKRVWDGEREVSVVQLIVGHVEEEAKERNEKEIRFWSW